MTIPSLERLRLLLASGYGPKSIRYVLATMQHKGIDSKQLVSMDENEFEKQFPELGKGRLQRATYFSLHQRKESELARIAELLEKRKIAFVEETDSLYPPQILRHLGAESPVFLTLEGEPALLSASGVAIAGARNATPDLLRRATEVAHALARSGQTIISGYAVGTDSAAHQGALDAAGKTIALLSMGILNLPKREGLAGSILASHGLFVSQFHPTAHFSGHAAMRRNKLVCALSNAMVVIACDDSATDDGTTSGTLHAARFALKLGLPLHVLDSPISPEGNRTLIEEGGIPFTSVPEIASTRSVLTT